MFLTKMKLGTAAALCACLIGGSFTSLGIAQDAKPKPAAGHPLPGAENGDNRDIKAGGTLKESHPPGKEYKQSETAKVEYAQPFAIPSSEEILKALPEEQPSPNNPRIKCELIAFHIEAPRFFPNVGQAQLSKAHFKCTVISDQGKEVLVYIDKDQLIPSK